MDEFEAIRLADYQGISQKEAAKSMQISQQTFSRILEKARRAIADSLVTGKIIRIQGGSCVINPGENIPPNPRKTKPRAPTNKE